MTQASRGTVLALGLVAVLLLVTPAAAQDQQDDRIVLPAQPDYTLITLPTAMRVPRHRSAFRVTHRFTRSLGQGNLGDLVGDAFGLDGGALLGLEYRFGLFSGFQVGVHRTSLDKTIELFTEYGAVQQSPSRPLGVAIWVSVEGLDNFRRDYSTAVGVVLSKLAGTRAAFYVEPIWVGNTNPGEAEAVNANHTLMLGLSTRVRVRPSVYLVGEWTPRLTGYGPGAHHTSFAIEKRAGGHVFQLNFSNAFGTTMAQVARGGLANDDWYMGFNISRRF